MGEASLRSAGSSDGSGLSTGTVTSPSTDTTTAPRSVPLTRPLPVPGESAAADAPAPAPVDRARVTSGVQVGSPTVGSPLTGEKLVAASLDVMSESGRLPATHAMATVPAGGDLDAPCVVIKIGTSTIMRYDSDGEEGELALSTLGKLVDTIVALRRHNFNVVLVTSGSVGVGCRELGLRKRPDSLRTKQAMAAIGQSKLMRVYDDLFRFSGQIIAQILLTRENLSQKHQYFNSRNTMRELLRLGVVPMVNENDTVATEELRFGDNDRLSSLVAGMVEAKWLFLLTDVDKLYTANPRKHPDAEPIDVVRDLELLHHQISTDDSECADSMRAIHLAQRARSQRGGRGARSERHGDAEHGDMAAVAEGHHHPADIDHHHHHQHCDGGGEHADHPVDRHRHPAAASSTSSARRPPRSATMSEAERSANAVPKGGTQWGSGGMTTKIVAAQLAIAAGVNVCIMHGRRPEGILERVLDKKGSSRVGTVFLASREPIRGGRKRWIAHGLAPKGKLFIDEGAAKAVARHHSLFAVGIKWVEGEFEADTAVSVHRLTDGMEIGRGLVNYSSDELKRVVGMHSKEMRRELGHTGPEEIIHRDNLVDLLGNLSSSETEDA